MNETMDYMTAHGWRRIGEGGTAGVYSNGKVFVLCNGTEWFASRTPDASERWSKGFANMLPAMKYGDGKC